MIRSVFLFIPFFLCLLLSDLSFATGTDSINVLVVDENDAPVGGVVVSIQGQQTFTSKSDGSYKLMTNKKIVLPVDASIVKKGYEIDELILTDSAIEVRIRKNLEEPNVLQLALIGTDGKKLNGVKVKYWKHEYVSNKNGLVDFKEDDFDAKQLSVSGFKLTKVVNKDGKYSLYLKPEITESKPQVDEEVSNEPNKVFIQYKKDFEALSEAVIKERERLLENNNKIREEIGKATGRLKNEKNLTSAQREELKNSIEKLEAELKENSIAYNKADEKTMQLINDLKLVVQQKDSINAATIKQLKVEQKKVVQAERKHKRTIIIFTIISISLVLLAVVFYSIARKMKKHKVELLQVTEELNSLKKELLELHN